MPRRERLLIMPLGQFHRRGLFDEINHGQVIMGAAISRIDFELPCAARFCRTSHSFLAQASGQGNSESRIFRLQFRCAGQGVQGLVVLLLLET